MGRVASRNENVNTETIPAVKNLDDLDKVKDNNNRKKFPDPRPPKRCKKDILPDVSKLKHIDDHVMKTPRYAERSIEKLAEYLIKPTTNDIEKVRAFYKWVTENISYDTESYFGRRRNVSNDPSSLLSCKSSVCDGYASIFQLLCDHAGIPVMKINGHSKGYSYKPGFNFSKDTPSNHAWNAVYVCGEWRFIETTWGAGTVGNNKQFKKNFTEFYFLTDPEHFIVDHYPCFDNDEVESAKWQLLKKPMSLEAFNRRIKPSRHAREWDIRFKSHKMNVLEMNKTIDIKFHTKSTKLDDVNVKLFDSMGRNKEQYVGIRKQNKIFSVTVTPPSSGEYTLDIYGSVGADSNTLECLITYVIKCQTVDSGICPFPKFDSFYGPVENWKERGFQNVGKIPTSITSKNGEVCVPIKVKDGTKVMATLKNSDDVKLVQYTLLEMDKHLKLRARLPKKGYYRLIVFSQFNSESSYTPVVNILVQNLKEPDITSPFPQTYPETLKFKCCLVEPTMRDLPANKEVRFRFSSSVMSEAAIAREHIAKKTSNTWDTTIKTPPFGEVRISGKINSDETSWVLYSFRVK